MMVSVKFGMLLTRDIKDTSADEFLRESVYSLFSLLSVFFFFFVFYNSKFKARCEVSVVGGHDAAVRVMSLPPVLLERKVNKPGVEGGREKEDSVRMYDSVLKGRPNDGTAAALSCT